jgi:hypothetical protein
MQTAHDQGNPGPDYQWGYGLVDIQAAVDLISRQAFRQESVDDDEVDVYYFVVPSTDEDVRVSLAWDDVEATFNADPALINDLDLELVAPDGTVWDPWILNAGSPANNATRGTNTVDNQEQVEVSSIDESDFVGTWMVRVTGASVPQGPQDYSLVCEGCTSSVIKPHTAPVLNPIINTEGGAITQYLGVISQLQPHILYKWMIM